MCGKPEPVRTPDEDEEGELIECEKCPYKFHPDDLDEEGYCRECVEGNEEAMALDRYFHSISR